jgi:hypothetical protein
MSGAKGMVAAPIWLAILLGAAAISKLTGGRKQPARRARTSAQLDADLTKLEARQDAFKRAAQRMSVRTREAERATAERLQQQQRSMRRELAAARVRTQTESRRLVVDQEQRFAGLLAEERRRRLEQVGAVDAALERERRAREQQVGALGERVDAMAAEERRWSEQAREWIDAAAMMHDFVAGNYRHQAFAPGALARFERDIHQAEATHAQGAEQSALALGQQTYHGLSDLRMQLEERERTHELWRSQAVEALDDALALVEANRQCQPVGPDGALVGGVEPVEVDWWTEGKLATLERELRSLLARVNDRNSPMRLDELRRVATDAGLAGRKIVEEAVRHARLAVLGSQLRLNLAETAVSALEANGFELQDATYEGADYRNAYAAKVKHRDGSEVVVFVRPSRGEPGRNELQIHSYDQGTRTEHELQERAAALVTALRARGVEVSDPQVTAPRADERLRDVNRLGQPAVARVGGRDQRAAP